MACFRNDCEVAATCFDRFAENQLGQYAPLIEEFARSLAFEKHPRKLFRAVSKTTAPLPETTCVAVEQFVELLDTDDSIASRTLRRSIGGAARLIVKTYAQAESSSASANLRGRCLDIIGQLVARQAYGIGDALSSFER